LRRFQLAASLLAVALLAVLVGSAPLAAGARHEEPRIEHVVVIGMDNYHLEDIERMPNLWNFLQQGALSTGAHHPMLPTRTAPDFSSIASGQYPDRHGVLNNTFRAPAFRVGFAYWENLAGLDPPTFLSEAPWKGFNEAGWDVGAVGFEGLVLESKAEVAAAGRDPARLDQYWGLAIHPAEGAPSFGTADIPEVGKEFPKGWENGWAGPPRKHAAITLRMTTLLQAAGVPITFTYVENNHTFCDPRCRELRKDDPQFTSLLEDDDEAFGRFFTDLAALGITPDNTLFVLVTDEGDHYLENHARPVDTRFPPPVIQGSNALLYSDDADGLAAALAASEGIGFVATRAAMGALHIADGHDARTPTFMAFSDPGYTIIRGCQTCFRWNHGTIAPDIVDIWLGVVGPGIRPGRLPAYTDHTDLVPTIRSLLGLPAAPDMDGVPILFDRDDQDLARLREAFKQLNAPLGRFGLAVLARSTRGVRGGPEDRAEADAQIADLAGRRDALVTQIRPVLDGSKHEGRGRIRRLLHQAEEFLREAA